METRTAAPRGRVHCGHRHYPLFRRCVRTGRPAGRSHISRPTGAHQRPRETTGAGVSTRLPAVLVAAADDDRATRGAQMGTGWRSTVGLVSTTRSESDLLPLMAGRTSGMRQYCVLVLVSCYLGGYQRHYADWCDLATPGERPRRSPSDYGLGADQPRVAHPAPGPAGDLW